MDKLFIGPFVHSVSLESPLIIQKLSAILVSYVSGEILNVFNYSKQTLSDPPSQRDYELFLEELGSTFELNRLDKIVLKKNQFLIPGFIDVHIHGPQYPNSGLGTDLPLLPWLNTYTFPMEQKFSSQQFAKKMYSYVVRRTLSNGTTTACYYGDLRSSRILVDVMKYFGQRGLVGKVCMDRNVPEGMIQSTAENIQDTKSFIEYVLSDPETIVRPCITPRFAISCTSELMFELSKLSMLYSVPIQTHLSENLDEISFVSELFPECSNYTAVYESHGLLSESTIMAHAIHLTQAEIDILKGLKVGVAHCPVSNFNLVSGICGVKNLLKNGINVGLGSDVSGGYSASMLEVMRQTVLASKALNFQYTTSSEDNYLSSGEVFYLATLGSAKVLGLDQKVGSFQVGKKFDACIVELAQLEDNLDFGEKSMDTIKHSLMNSTKYMVNNIDHWNSENNTISGMFERFFYLGDDRNIVQVWVDGKLVKS